MMARRAEGRASSSTARAAAACAARKAIWRSAYQPAAQGQKVERRKGSRKGTDVAWTKPEPCAVSYDTVYWERRLAKGAVAKANPLEG